MPRAATPVVWSVSGTRIAATRVRLLWLGLDLTASAAAVRSGDGESGRLDLVVVRNGSNSGFLQFHLPADSGRRCPHQTVG